MLWWTNKRNFSLRQFWFIIINTTACTCTLLAPETTDKFLAKHESTLQTYYERELVWIKVTGDALIDTPSIHWLGATNACKPVCEALRREWGRFLLVLHSGRCSEPFLEHLWKGNMTWLASSRCFEWLSQPSAERWIASFTSNFRFYFFFWFTSLLTGLRRVKRKMHLTAGPWQGLQFKAISETDMTESMATARSPALSVRNSLSEQHLMCV